MITLGRLRKIAIPRFGRVLQDEIRRLWRQSLRERRNGELLLAEAQRMLERELGLDATDPSSELAYHASLSEVLAARRWDAEYHQPGYQVILDRISSYKYGYLPIGRVLASKRKPIDPSREPEKQFRYIEIGSIDILTGWVHSSPVAGYEAPANAKIRVSGGEILVSLVRPARGAIGLVPEDIGDSGVCSGAFYVADAPSPSKETMYVYLRAVRRIFERFCSGTSYPTIKLDDVERLPAPLLPDNLQVQLAEKVQESIRCRRRALQLLDQAKRQVEDAIEQEARS